jgi:hypothetical protein
LLALIRVHDKYDFIMTHENSLWILAIRASRPVWQGEQPEIIAGKP